jgi:hypothetical protein
MRVRSQMNRHDEESTLVFLDNLPPLSIHERLYVGSNGYLVVDTVHEYLGGVGRRVLNIVVGGYNRTDILGVLEDLFTRVTLLANRCVAKLSNPYTQGNITAFNMRTLDTTHYEHCTTRIAHGMDNIHALLETLIIIYHSDPTTCVHFRTFLNTSETIHKLLRPVLPASV